MTKSEDRMTNQFRNPNDEWRRTAKRRSQPAVSSLKPPVSSLPLKRRGEKQEGGRKCLSPEFPGGFNAEVAEDGGGWGKGTANGERQSLQPRRAGAEVAEKDGNRVTAGGLPKRGAPRGR